MRAAPVNLTGAAASHLRLDLDGWTVDAIAELVGERAVRALDREQLVPARLAARADGSRASLLTRLFALGDTLTVAEVSRALPTLGLEGAVASGLVLVGDERREAHDPQAHDPDSRHADAGGSDAVRAAVDLRPYESDRQWWVASDLGESVTGHRLAEDHVLGIGGASLTLASITMRRPVGRVLDLGTGCGIQALHAATHAESVVATDISQRALACAAFNAALNEVALDLRLGSMLEPVEGEQFDLVVSNPPFVITPPGAPSFEYRDGGMAGDGIVGSLVSNVGSVLAPGGVAQMLGNWEIRDGWSDRIEEWIAASPVPLDAWVIQRDLLDAAEYAETWLRDAGVVPERGRAEFDAAYEAYLADFDRRGVKGIGFGMVLLRRAVGAPTLRRLEEFEGPLPTPMGPHLLAAMDAHDWLEATNDAELLDARLTAAPDVTRETYGRALAADPEHILIRRGGSFGRAVRADTALAGFVGACDGELAVGQILAGLGALGVEAGHLPPAVRDLVRDGFLLR